MKLRFGGTNAVPTNDGLDELSDAALENELSIVKNAVDQAFRDGTLGTEAKRISGEISKFLETSAGESYPYEASPSAVREFRCKAAALGIKIES